MTKPSLLSLFWQNNTEVQSRSKHIEKFSFCQPLFYNTVVGDEPKIAAVVSSQCTSSFTILLHGVISLPDATLILKFNSACFMYGYRVRLKIDCYNLSE